ncbi:16S rRNA (adenine(1518)-N(6)/adenine(1519)-N(6))-dimethyltransferase RsmA [Proteiniborus sp. MB09-C3]|uniref:16S rRNA (adenine(1518)-N(6)/adenine(1519)-N(6))- dimethyltransferase RsmA n=1 Tax=Proteiniborus sp. MB09-C3 TaxID=3050072 RepID=UPI002552C97E|nr:16S rRNA (adenine(1518)-N(6)/adenine(1519)-N(6))-dimethyltransferase RsmA [Proteiniborus sp. MB09-C3]WIV12305.1 16S rRNA (adenine(1518)-N(6)/adenine(1519)-N(6))-dimethyltransferase RsmA [Proteiniborus sp. MB09-C3]
MKPENRRLYSPAVVKKIIEKHGFRFSKSLGQNFLIDGNIIDRIIEGANIKESDGIIEVGPGIGTLTQKLCESAGKVVAIELDNNLLQILEETLGSYDNVEVIHGDVLKVDLNQLIKEKLEDRTVKVVANLPYYITTPIIMKLLEENLNIDKIVVMVQKEVAHRMKAVPGNKDYGALSIAVQYYSKPEIIVDVPKNVFMPRPNVDSAVIMLDVYNEPVIKVKDEKLFFNVVKAAFGKRRKTLLNALTSGIGLKKEEIEIILEKCSIDPVRRGETLDSTEFAGIADEIYMMINNY